MALYEKNYSINTDWKEKRRSGKGSEVLTGWGCLIKTRLGIHDGVLDNCSDTGLLILEMVGTDEQNQEIARKLSVLPGVSSKLVELELS